VAKRLLGKQLRINMDVRWVTKQPANWLVRVWKMPTGTTSADERPSRVDADARHIDLNTLDLSPRAAENAVGAVNPRFETPPHEFGHTLGVPTNHPLDEYKSDCRQLQDSQSIMNIGRTIRARHLAELINALNKLSPGAGFEAAPRFS
jgi:hypothetical protein